MVFIAVQMFKIKELIDYDSIERIASDYQKYYEVYKDACTIRKIVPERGLSIKEMDKVIKETCEIIKK
jgi:hypothetical protein